MKKTFSNGWPLLPGLFLLLAGILSPDSTSENSSGYAVTTGLSSWLILVGVYFLFFGIVGLLVRWGLKRRKRKAGDFPEK